MGCGPRGVPRHSRLLRVKPRLPQEGRKPSGGTSAIQRTTLLSTHCMNRVIQCWMDRLARLISPERTQAGHRQYPNDTRGALKTGASSLTESGLRMLKQGAPAKLVSPICTKNNKSASGSMSKRVRSRCYCAGYKTPQASGQVFEAVGSVPRTSGGRERKL